MPTLNHSCEECDSQFTILYELEKTDDDPHFCPFCATYLILDKENSGEEE
jgi:hypothetical protein